MTHSVLEASILEALYKNFFRQKKKVDPVIKALEKVPIFEHLSEKN